MERDHQAHLARVQSQIARDLEAKYTAGQEKHGGRLWERSPESLEDEAYAEALDLVIYHATIREARQRARGRR